MPVSIRLSRIGTKHVPFFRLVIVDSRKKRDGQYIENIGTYDAEKSKLVQFNQERYEAWVKLGAQPSDTAKKLYKLYKKETSKSAAPIVKKAVKAEVEQN